MYTYNAEVLRLDEQCESAYLHVDLGFSVWKTILVAFSSDQFRALELGSTIRVNISQFKKDRYRRLYRGNISIGALPGNE